MAKQKSKQTPLFEQNIPEMSEGYYSLGPNPNLKSFVDEHSTPYNPNDPFEQTPYNDAIVDESDTSIYNMHPYWSKKPHGAIAEYIKHFTEVGDLVLDPFSGSGGTTAVASQLGRASIAIDISPAASFIAKHISTPHSISNIDRLYAEMMKDLTATLHDLYHTVCHKCDGQAEIQYVVWSQTYKCSKCLEIIPRYSWEKSNCPNCGDKMSTSQERYGYIPVLTNIRCLEGCKPARMDRAIDSKDPHYREAFKKYDLSKIENLQTQEIPFWYPTDKFPHEWVSWRPNLEEAGNVSGFFTHRNLWAASAINDWIERNSDNPSSSWLKFAFTASIMSISKKAQHLEGGGGYIPGNYVFPPQIKERNVFNTYASLYKKMLKGLEVINNRNSTTNILISTQSSRFLPDIPDNSIDYIFTDPPYSDKVPFGEFNFLWEVWLQSDLSWNKDEIIVNPKLGKDLDEWNQMMKDAVHEMYRVLKPGRWATLCYHDSAEGSWMHLQDIFAEVGFISEQADKVLSIERTRKSWKQATTEKVQKRDLVINFRKPIPDELPEQLTLFGDEDAETFQEKVQNIVMDLLSVSSRTRDQLYDSVVSRMVRKGQFERHNFDTLLSTVAENVNGRWYLLETADQIDDAESSKEDNAANRLEKYMIQALDQNPSLLGIHYSDLFEQYLPVGDKPRRSLFDWLPEYFFKTTEGTWRPPINDEERQQKMALRTSGALRRIKRFSNALIEGVPPADRDTPENTATAANWIRQCRRAGLYRQGRAIYERGGFKYEELGDEAAIEVQEDYQICVRRSN